MLSSIACGCGGTAHYNEWMNRASNSAAAHNHSVTESGAELQTAVFPYYSATQIWSMLACDLCVHL